MSAAVQGGHTAGPWTLETVDTSIGICHKIGPFPSNGVHRETYACVYADGIRRDDLGHSAVGDELLANARLIAAAPALLEALRVVTDLLADHAASCKDLHHAKRDQHGAHIECPVERRISAAEGLAREALAQVTP